MPSTDRGDELGLDLDYPRHDLDLDWQQAHSRLACRGERPGASADRGLGRAGPEPRAFRAGARRAGGKMFTNVPGGFPIEVGGEVIGAGAAGGAKIEQDVEVAKAALAVLKL